MMHYDAKTKTLTRSKSSTIVVEHSDFLKRPLECKLIHDAKVGLYGISVPLQYSNNFYSGSGKTIEEACESMLATVACWFGAGPLYAMRDSMPHLETWEAANPIDPNRAAFIADTFIPQTWADFSAFYPPGWCDDPTDDDTEEFAADFSAN